MKVPQVAAGPAELEARQFTRSPSTRNRLLNAAAKLLTQRGAAALSVTQVARAAKVSRGLVYRYFHDRDQLLREAAVRAGRPVNIQLARSFKRQPGRRINADPQRARGRLLDAVVQLLAQKGAVAFCATEAANFADVSRDFVYKHFRDRGHLLREAKAWASEQLFETSTADAPPNITLGAIASIMSNPRAYGLKDFQEISIKVDIEKTLVIRLHRCSDACPAIQHENKYAATSH